MSGALRLPPEIIFKIIEFCDPKTLIQWCQATEKVGILHRFALRQCWFNFMIDLPTPEQFLQRESLVSSYSPNVKKAINTSAVTTSPLLARRYSRMVSNYINNIHGDSVQRSIGKG